jgi:NAD-dependent aldehyde dehydrogenases
MGFDVAKEVHGRLGRTVMELGGNNALIVAPTADLEMATNSIFFGAVGTAGSVALRPAGSLFTNRSPMKCGIGCWRHTNR